MGELTLRQRVFVQAYMGNASEAARQAGYSAKTAYSIGQELLNKPEIVEAIKEREQERLNPLIADREDRQKFWTDVMNDESAEMQHRLKAAELLGRSEGDFMERLQVDSTIEVVGYLFEPNQRRALLAEIEEEE